MNAQIVALLARIDAGSRRLLARLLELLLLLQVKLLLSHEKVLSSVLLVNVQLLALVAPEIRPPCTGRSSRRIFGGRAVLKRRRGQLRIGLLFTAATQRLESGTHLIAVIAEKEIGSVRGAHERPLIETGPPIGHFYVGRNLLL